MPSNPNCKVCNTEITNPDFKFIWYQEGFEDIDIGPYCPDCFVKIKVCSGCQHPFTKDQVTHVGQGRHFCQSCIADLEVCGKCGREETIHKTIDGVKWCYSCFSKHHFTCSCCEEVKLKDEHKWTELERAKKKGLFKKYPSPCKTCYEKVKTRFKTYDIRKCKHCKDLYGKGANDSGHYCPRCYSSFHQCAECGVKTPKTKKYASTEGNRLPLCENCSSKVYKICDFCGGVSKDSKRISGTKQDFNMCTNCSESESKGECKLCLKPTELNDGVCRTCYNTYHGNKCFCGAIRDFEGNCRVCDRSPIYSYSTKPKLVFNHTEKDAKAKEKIYFGFENEMTFSSGATSHLKKIYKAYDPSVLLAKSDSSIRGEGYEVVSQPMTLRYFHKMNLAPLFAGRNIEHSSCGLHIHVSREAFANSLHILKVTKLLQDNPEFTDKVAGRSAGSYNSNFQNKVSKVVKGDKEKNRVEGRGCRINLTNDVTIEFRMFLGADTEYKLRYRVEFLAALVEWTEHIGLSQATPEEYEKFISKNNKKFPNIYRFLNG